MWQLHFVIMLQKAKVDACDGSRWWERNCDLSIALIFLVHCSVLYANFG